MKAQPTPKVWTLPSVAGCADSRHSVLPEEAIDMNRPRDTYRYYADQFREAYRYYEWPLKLLSRLARRAFTWLLIGAWALWTVLMITGPLIHAVYKLGEPGRAHVATCREYSSRGTVIECSGTWALDDGTAGGGRISGAGYADVDRTVPVRALGSGVRVDRTRLDLPLVAIPLLIVTLLLRRGRRARAPETPQMPPPPPPSRYGPWIEGEVVAERRD
jgi:hypothetical protein